MPSALTQDDQPASVSREYAGVLHPPTETSESHDDGGGARSATIRKHALPEAEANVGNTIADISNSTDKAPQWQCALCGTSRTPMKRNHPVHGPKTLCNACGVRLSRRVKASEKVKAGTRRPCSQQGSGGPAPDAQPAKFSERESEQFPVQPSAAPFSNDSSGPSDFTRRQSSRTQQESLPPTSVAADASRHGALCRPVKRRPRDEDNLALRGLGENAKRKAHEPLHCSFSAGAPVVNSLMQSTMLEGAKLGAKNAPSVRDVEAERYSLDDDDRSWVNALNRDPYLSSSLSNLSSPDRSSASDMTAHIFDPDSVATISDAIFEQKEKAVALSESQFSAIIGLLESFSAMYACTEGVSEDQAQAICESNHGLPYWQVCKRVYHYWLEKRKQQNHMPLLQKVWQYHQQGQSGRAPSTRRPLRSMTESSADHRDAANIRGYSAKPVALSKQQAVGAQVVAATLRRHSSAVTLPEGSAGERVSQILDTYGLQTGQLEGSVGAAVQAAICCMRKENGCTSMIIGKKRGEKVGSCNFEVPGMSRLELGTLDAANDVQESLLGASLLVRKEGSGDISTTCPAVVPVTTRYMKQSSPALVCQDRSDMTYIVMDDPFEPNWNKLLAKLADKPTRSSASAPKRCASVPPATSQKSESTAAYAPACVVPVAGSNSAKPANMKFVLPSKATCSGGVLVAPQHALNERQPGASTSAADTKQKPVQQYVLMSPVGVNQQGVFRVPLPFVVQQGKPVAGEDGLMQVSGPTWSFPAPDGADFMQTTPANMPLQSCASSGSELPRRPQSVPPHGTPATSFTMQCIQHPMLASAGPQLSAVCQGQYAMQPQQAHQTAAWASSEVPRPLQAMQQQLSSMPAPTSAH